MDKRKHIATAKCIIASEFLKWILKKYKYLNMTPNHNL